MIGFLVFEGSRVFVRFRRGSERVCGIRIQEFNVPARFRISHALGLRTWGLSGFAVSGFRVRSTRIVGSSLA